MKTRASITSISLKILAGALLCSAGTASAQLSSYEYQLNLTPNWGDDIFQHTSTLDYSLRKPTPGGNSGPAFYPTWTAPNGQFVRYFEADLHANAGCYDITSGSLGDPILYTRNNAGSWVSFADDNAGSAQFRARVYVESHEDIFVRVSPYWRGDSTIQVSLTMKSVKAHPGTGTAFDNCHVSGVPYRETVLNGGNPM